MWAHPQNPVNLSPRCHDRSGAGLQMLNQFQLVAIFEGDFGELPSDWFTVNIALEDLH